MKKLLTSIAILFMALACYAQTTITMEEDSGVYKVPCKVNGLKLKFIFDTGASSVSMSSTIANMMLENGYLSESDIKGSGSSQIANGQIVDHTQIVIREIEIAGLVLRNVNAVVIHSQSAPLLLGQSAIQKLGKVSISGNSLTINLYSNQTKGNGIYTSDELWSLYQEAYELYSNHQFIVAAEKFDILYQQNYLNTIEIKDYANCLGGADRRQESYNMYRSLEDVVKSENPELIGSLYSNICDAAYWAGDFSSSIRYGALAISKLNILERQYLDSCFWMSTSYSKLGDRFKAQNTLENYIVKYTQALGISITDCWTKGYIDPNIATAYRQIGYLYETYGEAKKYIIIAAAWGNKDAIETCREFGWSYTKKPYEYVY